MITITLQSKINDYIDVGFCTVIVKGNRSCLSFDKKCIDLMKHKRLVFNHDFMHFKRSKKGIIDYKIVKKYVYIPERIAVKMERIYKVVVDKKENYRLLPIQDESAFERISVFNKLINKK